MTRSIRSAPHRALSHLNRGTTQLLYAAVLNTKTRHKISTRRPRLATPLASRLRAFDNADLPNIWKLPTVLHVAHGGNISLPLLAIFFLRISCIFLPQNFGRKFLRGYRGSGPDGRALEPQVLLALSNRWQGEGENNAMTHRSREKGNIENRDDREKNTVELVGLA